MTSRLDLLNDIMDALGEPALVTATISTNSSDNAKRADRALRRAEKIIAERHPWNWMTTIEQLAESETDEPIGWDYEFTKPANCLRIAKVTIDGGWYARPISFEDRSGLILANSETTYLHFVDQARLESYGAWPEVFAAAVSSEAAWRAVMGTSQSRTRKEDLNTDRKTALAEAKTWDGQQQPAKPRYAGSFVSAVQGGWKSRENA